MHITVVYSPGAGRVVETMLELPDGSTLEDAARVSGLLGQYPELAGPAIQTGIWGQRFDLHHALREGDRVEIYRPLKVDPKVSRRERFSKQGVRTAGLFARSQTSPKPTK